MLCRGEHDNKQSGECWIWFEVKCNNRGLHLKFQQFQQKSLNWMFHCVSSSCSANIWGLEDEAFNQNHIWSAGMKHISDLCVTEYFIYAALEIIEIIFSTFFLQYWILLLFEEVEQNYLVSDRHLTWFLRISEINTEQW